VATGKEGRPETKWREDQPDHTGRGEYGRDGGVVCERDGLFGYESVEVVCGNVCVMSVKIALLVSWGEGGGVRDEVQKPDRGGGSALALGSSRG